MIFFQFLVPATWAISAMVHRARNVGCNPILGINDRNPHDIDSGSLAMNVWHGYRHPKMAGYNACVTT